MVVPVLERNRRFPSAIYRSSWQILAVCVASQQQRWRQDFDPLAQRVVGEVKNRTYELLMNFQVPYIDENELND